MIVYCIAYLCSFLVFWIPSNSPTTVSVPQLQIPVKNISALTPLRNRNSFCVVLSQIDIVITMSSKLSSKFTFRIEPTTNDILVRPYWFDYNGGFHSPNMAVFALCAVYCCCCNSMIDSGNMVSIGVRPFRFLSIHTGRMTIEVCEGGWALIGKCCFLQLRVNILFDISSGIQQLYCAFQFIIWSELHFNTILQI